MADDTRIEVELVLNNKGIDKPLKEQEKKISDSGKKSGQEFDKGFRAGIGPIAKVVAGIGTALAGAFAVGKVVEAAKVQEDAVNQLNASLRNLGQYTPELSQELQNFASSMQSVTTHGDEAIIQQMAFAQAMGASVEQSKQIVQVAADMSAALNIDFNAAVRNTSKTLGGLAGELGEVIPELKNLTKEQMQAGGALDLLANKFSGFAASQVNTFSGAVTQLNNTFGDLLEEVGFLITKSPSLVAVFKTVSETINNAIKSVNSFGSHGDALRPIILGVISFGEAVNMFLIAPTELAYNATRFTFHKIVEIINAGVAIAGKALGALADVANAHPLDTELTRGLQAFRESSNEVFQESAQAAHESWNEMFNFDVATSSATFLENLRLSVEDAKAITEEGGNAMKKNLEPGEGLAWTWENMFSQMVATMQTFNTKVTEFSKKIAQTLHQGIGASAANAFASFGKAAVEGDNMMKAFINSFLGSMGQMAIQLGSMFILEGMAMTWAGLPNGPALIGAGAALAAFGGVMGALFGGAGGGASSGGGGVAVSEPGTSPGNPVFTEPTATQANQEPQTSINLVVQGDILDSEETGTRLVQLLNDNFETKGARLTGGYA